MLFNRIMAAGVLSLACCFAADTLRDAGAARGVLIGAAVDPSHLGEAQYATVLAREFSQAQPENAMKMSSVRPARDRFDFSQPDAIVAFAEAHNMKVRGHTLMWHEAVPGWLKKGGFSPAEMRKILDDHIQGEVSHFAGRVYAWDVVNEAITDKGTMRSTIWYDQPGIGVSASYGAIEEAFRAAHKADPAALLFYNDYDNEVTNRKSDAIYAMVQELLHRGVPIHGVGFQAHLQLKGVSKPDMIANLRRFVALGLQVQITELDVRVPVAADGSVKPEDLQQEARIYRDVADACLAVPHCTAIQTWGFTDRYSWLPHEPPGGFGAGLPFDADYHPKPAYRALLEALQTR